MQTATFETKASKLFGSGQLQPFGNAAAHDPFQLGRRKRFHFFGKQRHHLFVRAGQMRQIRAPKTALRAEGVDDAAHQRMQRWKRISLVDVAGQRRNFNRDVLSARKLDHVVDRGVERFAAQHRVQPHVIDDQPQARMALGDFA